MIVLSTKEGELDESKIGGGGAERMLFRSVTDLEPGMLLALPLSNDRDLIDAKADKFMANPAEVRKVAAIWKDAIQRHLAASGNYSEFAKRMAKAGQPRDPGTIKAWGVVLPDIVFGEESPEWDTDVIYDKRDEDHPFVDYLERLEKYFRERLAETGRSQPQRLGPAWVNQIADCLRGNFEVVSSIKGLLLDSHRELISLSPDQFRVLDFALHEGNPRIVCDGAAGTGKTLIAMEAARRLTAEGRHVLFLCFNDNLHRYLARDAADLAVSVKVATVYGFLGEVIRAGGFREELAAAHREQANANRDDLYRRRYPDLFDLAAEVLLKEGKLPQFDAVIIDEAQDMLDLSIMNCLDVVLTGGFTKGRWLVCMDTGFQSDIYGRMNPEVLQRLRSLAGANLLLKENFRNPRNVVSEMCHLLNVPLPICRRSIHSNVDYRVYSDERDQGRRLRALLIELLKEGIRPGDITILSGKAREFSSVTRFPPDMGKEIRFLGPGEIPPADAISASTISAFKGLENDIIVLTDVPSVQPMTDWASAVLYVGMTRVRSKIFALVDKAFLDGREQS